MFTHTVVTARAILQKSGFLYNKIRHGVRGSLASTFLIIESLAHSFRLQVCPVYEIDLHVSSFLLFKLVPTFKDSVLVFLYFSCSFFFVVSSLYL